MVMLSHPVCPICGHRYRSDFGAPDINQTQGFTFNGQGLDPLPPVLPRKNQITLWVVILALMAGLFLGIAFRP